MRPSNGFSMLRVSRGQPVGEVVPFKSENDCSEGLTCIHPRIHCAATQDTDAPHYTEAERVMVENFLNTLAEVAMAVATRKAGSQANERD